MIKIKSYKIGPRGARGKVIGLPKVWTDDMDLKKGDVLDIYRDKEDRLILVAKKNIKENNKCKQVKKLKRSSGH